MTEIYPFRSATEVTPHDTNELSGGVTRGVWCSGAGDLALILADDSVAVTLAIPQAGYYPLKAKIILSTGTTVTTIHACY